MGKISQGEKGEAALLGWLHRDNAAVVRFDQTLETFSPIFKGDTKRPDFLVGFPTIGTIALDAKCKTLYKNNSFILDDDELKTTHTFEFQFGIYVWFVFFQPTDMRTAYIGSNQVLRQKPRTEVNGQQVITAHVTDDLIPCNLQDTMLCDAIYRAIFYPKQ